jgi:uncharacterized membrane protein YozB (DUF420 family)
MGQLLNGPGFLHTHATLFTDLTLVAVLAVGFMFTRGVYLVRRGNPVGHHFNQIIVTIVIIIIAAWLMILPFRDFVMRDLGGPRPSYFYIITVIHALVGLAAILIGVFVVLASNNLIPNVLPLARYKPVMRVSYAMFMIAILTGIIVYITWFILVPKPPTF